MFLCGKCSATKNISVSRPFHKNPFVIRANKIINNLKINFMIAQTVQFQGMTPEALYNAYLSSKDHAAMVGDGKVIATFHRPDVGDVAHGEEGDELRAWGYTDPDGNTHYYLTSKILKLVPGKLIVSTWKNAAWNLAVDLSRITDLESTLILTFKKNIAGAEIQMIHINVPDYEVHIPETGEAEPLSTIVNTHWGLQYWEPMKRYFEISK
jgi:uncharacterized protein YndB with AHSA1/START domain